MMHIGLWSPAWPPESHHNGIVTYAHWMRCGLQELGHRVTIFTRTVDAAAACPDVRMVQPSRWHRLRHRLARHGVEQRIFDFADSISAAILRVHRRDRLDILDMEESFGWFERIQRRTGLPLVVKLHGPAFLSLVGDELETRFGQRKIEREGAALRCAPVIVSPSRDTLERTLVRFQLAPGTQRCLLNPLALSADSALWQLSRCDRHTLLYVGRFDERKGADVLLQAFALLRRRRPELRLIFVGPDWGLPGPDGRLSFAAYCRRMLDAASARSIDFRGPLPSAEIMRLRAGCYLTVIASRWENQSYALLEAMLQGCPVICSDAGGCPESITHGVNGRLARSGEPRSFAAEISVLLDDPTAAERLGQAARRHVQMRHAPSQVAAQAVALYRELLAGLSGMPRLRQAG